MKPFDLEKAIAGEKMVTRDGREVQEFAYFKTSRAPYEPIRSVIGGCVFSHNIDGSYLGKGNEDCSDLFMAPKKRTVYVNIYDKAGESQVPGTRAFAFSNEEDARMNVNGNAWGLLLAAHPVVIEE